MCILIQTLSANRFLNLRVFFKNNVTPVLQDIYSLQYLVVFRSVLYLIVDTIITFSF